MRAIPRVDAHTSTKSDDARTASAVPTVLVTERHRVLFVCLGNICRSPTAEGVFRALVDRAGLSGAFEIDSAGTGDWHAGLPADARMRGAARQRGYVLDSTARVVSPNDFERFDHILAMDQDNFRGLLRLAPAAHRSKIRMFRDDDPEGPGKDVPDPYYGGAAGFEHVLDIVERTARALLTRLSQRAPR